MSPTYLRRRGRAFPPHLRRISRARLPSLSDRTLRNLERSRLRRLTGAYNRYRGRDDEIRHRVLAQYRAALRDVREELARRGHEIANYETIYGRPPRHSRRVESPFARMMSFPVERTDRSTMTQVRRAWDS